MKTLSLFISAILGIIYHFRVLYCNWRDCISEKKKLHPFFINRMQLTKLTLTIYQLFFFKPIILYCYITNRKAELTCVFLRNLRHRSILGTNVGTHLNGKFVSLLNALALQDAGTECTGKAVACTDSISHLNLWSLLE